ncbi:MAG: FAD-binding oxidoreductase [bacterium]
MAVRRGNVYMPDLAVVEDIRPENKEVTTYTLRFLDPLLGRSFDFLPGQFTMVSVFGSGEDSAYYSSSPSARGKVDITVQAANGAGVPVALARLEKGAMVGLRGPTGNGMPLPLMQRKRVYLIGDDTGFIPLRSLANYAVDNPTEFERMVVMGAYQDDSRLVFSHELFGIWAGHSVFDVKIVCKQIFQPREGLKTGGVSDLFDLVEPAASNSLAVISGSPEFLKECVTHLVERDFRDAQIHLMLSRKYVCGYGMCGSCKIGEKYLCVDGPVFPLSEIRRMPAVL